MCVALPVTIMSISIDNGVPIAIADIDGTKREVNLSLTPEAVVGDHLIVHSGIAVRIVSADEAGAIWSTVEDALGPR